MGFSLRKDVDFEIVLLRKVLRINEKRSQVVLSGIVSSEGCCLKKMIKKISVLSTKTQLTRQTTLYLLVLTFCVKWL